MVSFSPEGSSMRGCPSLLIPRNIPSCVPWQVSIAMSRGMVSICQELCNSVNRGVNPSVRKMWTRCAINCPKVSRIILIGGQGIVWVKRS